MVILFPTTFGDDFRASFNAFVTDEYTWTCNQLPNAILRIGAEGASEVRVLLVSVVSASEHVCLDNSFHRTILALSRERRGSHASLGHHRRAPLVGLQRRVSPRAPTVYPSHSKEGLFEPAAS